MYKKLLLLLCVFAAQYHVMHGMEAEPKKTRSRKKGLAQLVAAFDEVQEPQAKKQAKSSMLSFLHENFTEQIDPPFLHIAARHGHLSLVQLLYTLPDFHQLTYKGNNPLHEAVRNGHLDVVRCFLNYGVLCHENGHRDTPLHLAARSGKQSAAAIIDLLIKYDKRWVTAINPQDKTALDCIGVSGDLAAAEVLIAKGATLGKEKIGITSAIFHEHVPVLEFFLNLPDNHSLISRNGNLLVWAIRVESPDSARFLLGRGADITACDDVEGRNPFFAAASKDRAELLVTAPQVAQFKMYGANEFKRIVMLGLCSKKKGVPRDVRKILCFYLLCADLDELVPKHIAHVRKALSHEWARSIGYNADSIKVGFWPAGETPYQYALKSRGVFTPETIEILGMSDDQLKERYEDAIRKGYIALLGDKFTKRH